MWALKGLLLRGPSGRGERAGRAERAGEANGPENGRASWRSDSCVVHQTAAARHSDRLAHIAPSTTPSSPPCAPPRTLSAAVDAIAAGRASQSDPRACCARQAFMPRRLPKFIAALLGALVVDALPIVVGATKSGSCAVTHHQVQCPAISRARRCRRSASRAARQSGESQARARARARPGRPARSRRRVVALQQRWERTRQPPRCLAFIF